MDPRRFQRASLLLLVAVISAIFVTMIRQFLVTLLLAATFSGLFQPLFQRWLRLVRGRRSLASTGTLVTLVLLLLIPLLLLLGVLATQAISITESVRPWTQEQIQRGTDLEAFLAKIPGYDRLEPYRAEILTKLGEIVQNVGAFLISRLSALTRGTVAFFFHVSLMLYAMFFFLKDGRAILDRILYYIPLPTEDEDRMVGRFVSVARATLRGTLVIGVVQGGLAGLAFALVGIPSAVFWGTLMAVLSMIPAVGTALVWLPATIYLLATGSVGRGLFLLAFCGLVVGMADNLLRPRLVGQDTKMHDLLILFSTLGGLLLFGALGLVLGPIVAALFVTVWDIYGSTFRDVLPEVSRTKAT
jgi:predicted PurR-regulated permease PerM